MLEDSNILEKCALTKLIIYLNILNHSPSYYHVSQFTRSLSTIMFHADVNVLNQHHCAPKCEALTK